MLLFITLALYALPGLVIGFTLHELAHAVAVVRFGDDTPRHDGRLTLDPLEHIDPVGFALLLAIGFGFAKPVRYNALRIRNRYQQAALAAAGPLTNLALAVFFGLTLRLIAALHPGVTVPEVTDPFGTFDSNTSLGHGGAAYIACYVLYEAIYVNALLFIFNMIPIPPLDGFTVFRGLFAGVVPDLIAWMERNAQLLTFIGFALIFVLPRVTGGGGFSGAVSWLVDATAGNNPDYFFRRGFQPLIYALSG